MTIPDYIAFAVLIALFVANVAMALVDLVMSHARKPGSSVSVFLPCDVREPGQLESSPRITQKRIAGETVYVDAGYHKVG
jgi:hypothetical protein